MSKPRKPKGRPISGWLILDKPVDFGSTEAVSKIEKAIEASPRRKRAAQAEEEASQAAA